MAIHSDASSPHGIPSRLEQPSPITSAYIHVPFCRHRCGYCNFTLIADRTDLVANYLQCLEIELSARLTQPQRVQTLFLGGGTPTHLPVLELERLLSLLAKWFVLDPDGEYTCEANPLDCSTERLTVLKAAGVNRLSLGGQSFSQRKLKLLERDHTGPELQRTLDLASSYFQNLSLDLIFATPDESLAEWQQDLDIALRSPIQHVSTYGLTIERGSHFFGRRARGELAELEEDLQLAMYETTMNRLHAEGWQHYEISNFCRPGFQCLHNQTYWNGKCWWAFGPGAASLLPGNLSEPQRLHAPQSPPVMPTTQFDQWLLSTNHRSTTQYIKLIRRGLSPVAESECLDKEAWIRQRLVFGLRQIEGINLSELDAHWGRSVRPLFEPFLSRYLQHHWLEFEGNQLRLTRKGLVISDSLWPDLLISESS